VGQDVGVGAAGIFQSIAQDREVGEPAFLVNRLGQFANRSTIPGFPGGIGRSRAERVAEDAPHEGEMNSPFSSTPRFVVQAFAVVDGLKNPASRSAGTPVAAVPGKAGGGGSGPEGLSALGGS
jgi:hypothetical protein